MAVIELNLLNSQNEFSQMGEHFQDEHSLQKFSPKWESALPFGRKSPKLSVRPLLTISISYLVHSDSITYQYQSARQSRAD